jgi:glutaredoxin
MFVAPLLLACLALGAAPTSLEPNRPAEGRSSSGPLVRGLEKAQALLAAEKLDDVLFELEGRRFPKEEEGAAADLMAEAGARGVKSGDKILGLQFAQMALRLNPSHPRALEAAARTMLAQSEFGAAEQYADRWLESSRRSSPALLLRAQIALEQGEWDKAQKLADGIKAGTLTGAEDRKTLESVRKTARSELAERKGAMTQLKALEARMLDATVEAKKLDRAGHEAAPSSGGGRGVVLYGTTWCGYCAKARQWLSEHHVSFEDRDVEKDPQAAEEIAQKAARQHVRASGVPIIDFDGTIVAGFSAATLQSLLARRR